MPPPTPYVHSEAQLETLFRLRVRTVLGGQVHKIATGGGIPDRLVILPAQPGWGQRLELVELKKTPRDKLRPDQVVWHDRAAALGARPTVLSGLPEIEAWVLDRARQYDTLLDLL